MSKPLQTDPLPNDMTLKDLQAYVWRMNHERGFNIDDPSQKMVMLIEEVGELARAIRKKVGLKFSATTKQAELEEELADVQIVLLGLASLLDIDMHAAVAAKEAKNRKRTWK